MWHSETEYLHGEKTPGSTIERQITSHKIRVCNPLNGQALVSLIYKELDTEEEEKQKKPQT